MLRLPLYEKLRGAGGVCGCHPGVPLRLAPSEGEARRGPPVSSEAAAPRGGAGAGGGAGLGGPSPLSSPRRAGALRMMRRAGGRAAELPALLLSHRSARHRGGGAAGSAGVWTGRYGSVVSLLHLI